MAETGSLLTSLECRACCTEVEADRPATVCPTCGLALFATYRTESLDVGRWRRQLAERAPSLWRYRELLPVRATEHLTTLGEGGTPILPLGPIDEAEGLALSVKDDGGLPTGSFKARGMAVAVSRARELGIGTVFVPSAGNAGVALAAYGARAGRTVRVYLPASTPEPMRRACRRYGAELTTVAGTLREAGAEARRREAGTGAFDLSTLREPYRAEGKKTMGLEIWEQTPGDEFPDAIVYPTGGGTGIVGMDRAFRTLEELGLLDRVPRLYAVQPEGCAPIVRALRTDSPRAEPWETPTTVAPGLTVPAPFSSERILEAIRRSGGSGVTVTDAEIVAAVDTLARRHGVSASPEGAAPYAAIPHLLRERHVRPGERILLYNTGSGIPFWATPT